jgi:hypothetical protein
MWNISNMVHADWTMPMVSANTVLCELHFLPTLPLIRMRHVFSLEASSILAA